MRVCVHTCVRVRVYVYFEGGGGVCCFFLGVGVGDGGWMGGGWGGEARGRNSILIS